MRSSLLFHVGEIIDDVDFGAADHLERGEDRYPGRCAIPTSPQACASELPRTPAVHTTVAVGTVVPSRRWTASRVTCCTTACNRPSHDHRGPIRPRDASPSRPSASEPNHDDLLRLTGGALAGAQIPTDVSDTLSLGGADLR